AASLPALAGPAGLEAAATELRKGFDPKALKPGQRILYPPARMPRAAAQTESASAKHWWHIYSVPSPSMRLTPFGSGQEVPVLHYGTTLIAVRHDHDAAFRTRYAEPGAGSYKYLRELEKSPPAWFARTNTVDAGRGSVKTASPVYRVEKRMRITSIAKGVIGTEVVATRSFGKDGKLLTAEQIAAADRMNLILLLLAGGGLLGLVILLVRRSRRRVRTTVTAALLAALGLGLAAAPASADVFVEPEFTQSTQLVLDFGALRDRAVRVHHVAAGDTPEGIAKATLGSEARWEEIQAANPEVVRTELAVGYGLVIPPREPDADGWWHLFTIAAGGTQVRPIHDGEMTPARRWGPFGIVAVRGDGLATFHERLKETESTGGYPPRRVVGLERLKANPPAWFAYAPDVQAGRVALPEEHPVQRIERHVRIEGLEDGRLLTRVTSSRQFSAGGEELSRMDVVQHKQTRSLLYGLLAALG
ncbi:MAG: LysM domain-containing protein, partial [Planctomycetota bacterium]|nr:LysM domain-containing protein [Planctomycetota bacterium]